MSEEIHTVIASCCREYLAPFGYRGSRCLFCGTRPTYDREVCCDKCYQCPSTGDVECLEHGGFDVCCSHEKCPGKRQRIVAKYDAQERFIYASLTGDQQGIDEAYAAMRKAGG